MKIIALLLALTASAHEAADWTTWNGYHATLLRSGDNGAFRTDMRRAYALPDGSLVGWTDIGTDLVFQLLRPDGSLEDVARAPWSTPGCTLRAADGGPEFDVDATQGWLLVECHGAVGQLWRVDGFIACPCEVLRGAAIDPYEPHAALDEPPVDWRRHAEPDAGYVRTYGAGPWRVVELEVDGEDRERTWSEGHHAVPGMVVDDEDEEPEPEDDGGRWRVTSGWIVNGTVDGVSVGCDPLACDEDSRGVKCIEARDDRESVSFICDGAHWRTTPAELGENSSPSDDDISSTKILDGTIILDDTIATSDLYSDVDDICWIPEVGIVPCDPPVPSATHARGAR